MARDIAAPGSTVKRLPHVRPVGAHWVVEMRVTKRIKTWIRVESAEMGAKYADLITHYKGKKTFINKETAGVGAAVLPEGGLASFNKKSFQKFISDQFNNLPQPQTPTTTLPTPIAPENIFTSETSSCSANQHNASSSSYGTLSVSRNGNGRPETVIEPSFSSELVQILDGEEQCPTGAWKQASGEAHETEILPFLENEISADVKSKFDMPFFGIHECTMSRSSLTEIFDPIFDDLSPILAEFR